MAATEEAREGVKDAALEWVRNQRKLAEYQRAIAVGKAGNPAMSVAEADATIEETDDILAALGEFRDYLEAWDPTPTSPDKAKCLVELIFSSQYPDGQKHCLNHGSYYDRSESCPSGR